VPVLERVDFIPFSLFCGLSNISNFLCVCVFLSYNVVTQTITSCEAVHSVRVVYTQGVTINCNCSLFLTISFSLPLHPFFLCNSLFHSVTQCLFTLTHKFLLLIWQFLINEIYSPPIRKHLTRAATWLPVFGISCRGQFPDGDSFCPPASTTAKNGTVIARHFTFEMINFWKRFKMNEQHHLKMTKCSFANDVIFNLSVHSHYHVTFKNSNNNLSLWSLPVFITSPLY